MKPNMQLLFICEVSWGLLMLAFIKSGYSLMCSICDTEKGDTFCRTSPPLPQECTFCDSPSSLNTTSTEPTSTDVTDTLQLACTNYEFCNIQWTYVNEEVVHMSRGCYPFGQHLENCHKDYTNASIEICVVTCDTDGCNGTVGLRYSSQRTDLLITIALFVYFLYILI